jgi:hypothetical protein
MQGTGYRNITFRRERFTILLTKDKGLIGKLRMERNFQEIHSGRLFSPAASSAICKPSARMVFCLW